MAVTCHAAATDSHGDEFQFTDIWLVDEQVVGTSASLTITFEPGTLVTCSVLRVMAISRVWLRPSQFPSSIVVAMAGDTEACDYGNDEPFDNCPQLSARTLW